MKGLQYFAYTIREVIFDNTVCLAQLSDIDDDVRNIREFLHHSTPFFLVLLHFLFNIDVNTRDI